MTTTCPVCHGQKFLWVWDARWDDPPCRFDCAYCQATGELELESDDENQQ
jgi:hypothetical protein